MKVLIGPSSFGQEDPTPLNLLTEAGLQVMPNPFGRKLTKTEVLELLPGCMGLIAGLECVDHEVLSTPGLRVVSRCGSGLSNVNLDVAGELGVTVFSTPEGPTQAVAEMTLGVMLGLMRNVVTMNDSMHKRQWHKQMGFQLKGKTILIIGFGRIGRRLAALLEPFDLRILVCDPQATSGDCVYEIVSLADGIPQADIITLHASGEPILLGHNELSLIQKGAFILNAARGTLIDEEALIYYLKNGSIAGCWMDTFGREPYQGPLCGMDNVILTPHVGSYTREGRLNMEMEAATNLLKGLKLR
jgi:D-3-phosphoglycerate dehydrogenase